jgi:hypothetical protein
MISRKLFAPTLFAASLLCGGPTDAADPLPAATNIIDAGNDYFFQGEYVGSITGIGRCGLQVIAEGNGTFRGVVRPGGLPGEGWNREPGPEFVGPRDALSARLVGPDDHAIELTVGTAVVRDAFHRQLGVLQRTLRTSPTMGRRPADGAIVLFDGSSTDEFADAKISEAGYLMHGAITKRAVRDFDLHIEFKTPFMPTARGQARGNSGVYIQQRYEVQILDSFGLKGEHNECGGLYKTKTPDVNMCLPPLSWQTYDIEFRAARFDEAGKKSADARLTVVQNGIPVQNNFAMPNKTGAGKAEGPEPMPILLQNHGNPVEFRNVWMVER